MSKKRNALFLVVIVLMVACYFAVEDYRKWQSHERPEDWVNHWDDVKFIDCSQHEKSHPACSYLKDK